MLIFVNLLDNVIQMKLRIQLLFLICVSTYVNAQQSFSIYFDSNKSEVNSKELSRLNLWIFNHRDAKIVGIMGFCDEDGAALFNDTLSKKRMNCVVNLIKDKINLRKDYTSRSFGELHFLSQIKSENRKVTLYFIEEKDLARENEILGIAEIEPIVLPKSRIKYPEKLVFDNPNGTKTTYQLNGTFMQSLNDAKVGETIKIENLNFQINTYIVLPESKGKLYELLVVLDNNPNLKIEIQGHLCCMPIDRLDLSTQRAKAINNFLIANGIDKNRLTFRGYGSTKPLFPLPEKDEKQRIANRRVEIMIVAN